MTRELVVASTSTTIKRFQSSLQVPLKISNFSDVSWKSHYTTRLPFGRTPYQSSWLDRISWAVLTAQNGISDSHHPDISPDSRRSCI